MEDFKKEIDRVIKGEITGAKSKILVSPDEVDKYLTSLGFVQEDFDSNGWSWDFWMSYSKDGIRYTLSGSGWYNTGLVFRNDDF